MAGTIQVLQTRTEVPIGCSTLRPINFKAKKVDLNEEIRLDYCNECARYLIRSTAVTFIDK